MTDDEIIRDLYDYASEYCEMIENPDKLIIGILVKRMNEQQQQIDYLKKRLKNADCKCATRY